MDDRYLSHVRERCSWPRISKLRHQCLLGQLNRVASPETTDQHTLHIRVRLQPFERLLLERTLNSLHQYKSTCYEVPGEGMVSPGDAESAAIVLFFRWSWADNVLRLALTELDPAWVTECHFGAFRSALDAFQKQLRTRIRSRYDLYDRRYYRSEQLMRDNPHLANRDNIVLEEVTVVPDPADMPLWKRLGAYMLHNIENFVTVPGLRGQVADLLKLIKGNGSSGAARNYVAQLVEDTPEFPPRELYEGMAADRSDSHESEHDEMSNEEGLDKCSPGSHEPENDTMSDGPDVAGLMAEQVEERTRDWAKITAQKILEAENLWDVWSCCRTILVSIRNDPHRQVFEQFVASQEFARYWRISDNDGQVGRVIVAKDGLSEGLSKRLSEVGSNFFQEDAQEFMDLELRKQAHENPLSDPIHQFLFIPWEQLKRIEAESLTDQENGLGVDAKILNNTLCVAPVQDHEPIHCSLYLTDDLFPPHVESGYRYPAFMSGRNVVYLRQKLEETGFVRQLQCFWDLWNDCAITYDNNTQEFYLLQTLPGVKARELEHRAGLWSAFEFFDFKYRHRDKLSAQHDTLRQILGKEYSPSYSDFLLLIDPSEINLAGLERVGQGSFGRVYKARWERKPTRVLDHVEESPGDVALKVALGDRSWDDRAKFFIELSTAYSAVAGDSSGCVPFYGFCKVFVDESGQVIDSNAPNALTTSSKETFALVFDFAADGDILSFLNRSLVPGKPKKNWRVICEALSGLANGLMTIHKKNIIHRDIHPQNVLVQSKSLAEDGELEFECLLSDLGEGKDITRSAKTKMLQPGSTSDTQAPTNYATSFSLAEFIPPGAVNNTQGSKADDIFAWGQLGVEIIRANYNSLLRNKNGEVIYPARLMRVLERCIDPNPAGRFDAKTLVVVMEEVMNGPSGLDAAAYGGETEWYDGSYELPQLRKKLETTYGLRSSWLTLTSRKRVADFD